ncbi:MAG: transposase, partial [Coleofasciculus sp. G3-WIS-01]
HLSQDFNDKTKPNSRINTQSASRRKERNISCFLQGLMNIIADLICGKGISVNGLYPRQSFSLNTS